MRGLWVTITRVCPASWRRSNSRSTSNVAALSRLPVGSSASTTEGAVAERPGDRDALPLPSGESGRQVRRPIRQADLVEQLSRPATCPAYGVSSQERRKLHVLHGSELVHQVEGLEDETELVAAKPCLRPFRHPVHRPFIEPDFAIGRCVETSEKMKQRRLPAAAGTGYRNGLAGPHAQVELVDGSDQSLVLPVVLAEASTLQGPRGPWSGRRSWRHRPVALTGLQPTEVRPQPEHDALQQEGSVRAVGLRHGSTLGIAQPPQ